MNWWMLPIAFVAWMAAPLGFAIARGVQDEVKPNRTRFAHVRDALCILAAAIGVTAFLPWWSALLVAAALLLVRLIAALRWSASVVCALALGVATGSAQVLVIVALIVIVANVLAGALESSWRTTMARTLVQPLGAIIVAATVALA